MSEMDDFAEDIDERLEELDEKETALTKSAHFRSACRVANEIRRLAKAEQRLLPYISATFTLMNHAADLLDPEMGRDASLEIIGLLESEDRARSIQPDLPESDYQNYIDWYSSCGYDNLAKATAFLNGYNSSGMHACIADGIEVCRRTGKTQCVTCFREYATEVYRAADDVSMAMHFAQMGVAHEDPGPHDRRWAGAQDLVDIHLYNGQFNLAAEHAQQQLELCEVWHSPPRARMVTKYDLIEISHLIGDPTKWDGIKEETEPPEGEYPALELARDMADAVVACCKQDFSSAVELLTKCDQILTKKICLPTWFKVRLRLLSTLQLAIRGGHDVDGKYEKLFERLASQLETRAVAARDYMTLSCLKRLRDPNTAIAPVPTLSDVSFGPFAKSKDREVSRAEVAPISDSATESAEQSDHQEDDAESAGALLAKTLYQRFIDIKVAEHEEKEVEDSIEAILKEMLTYENPTDAQPNDCLPLLAVATVLVDHGDQSPAVWEWAKDLAKAIPDNAKAKNLLADLGATLRFGPNESLEALISEDEIEQLFAQSLELDADDARNYHRAGDYYRFVENIGEAERCFARAFRLDRANPEVADKLARIYRSTDRQRDALAVLDMAIREGGPHEDLCWNAALLSHRLEQYEGALTYLDAYEQIHQDLPWVNHYRASSLLALDRPEEAMKAADRELELNPECPYPVLVHRALAEFGLKNETGFRERLTEALDHKLVQIDYLTMGGMMSLFRVLWKSVRSLDDSDPLRQRFLDVMVASGAAPDEVFDEIREQIEIQEELKYFRCVVEQPLDERWPESIGCLNEETEFKRYSVEWGVLAESEEAAVQLVLQWQKRSFPIAPEVAEVNCAGEDYRDHPGIVWQGARSEVS